MAAEEPKYTELFIVEFQGTLQNLKEHIEELDGVYDVSISKPGFRIVSSMEFGSPMELHSDIGYNSHKTDRTRLATEIEELDGVTEVTLG